MAQKSILEQALLQVTTLEEAVKKNAKGILASTMKQELNDLVNESMEDEEEVMTEQPIPDDEDKEEDMSDEEGVEPESDEPDGEIPSDDTEEFDDDDDSEEDSVDDMDSDDMDDDDMDSDDMDDDDDAVDMTKASDDELLKVFKALKPEDGIIVKKDGNSVEFNDGESEYIIKLDSDDEVKMPSPASYDMDDDELATVDEMSSTDDDDDDETIYEIELTDEPEQEMEEAARTKSNPHGNKGELNRAGIPSKKMYKAGSTVEINEELVKLKKQNGEYKKALLLFKKKLNEVAIFNASLAYSTRLFTEHTTTKKEKFDILKRFDTVKSMEESKRLFESIAKELVSKKPVLETVVEKITTAPTTSTSKEILAESKAYVDPQYQRMLDIMRKI